MKKQGPCHHCGTNSTPMWRNGPAEKPILCNACGSRYRIRGTLANYTPKHSQAQQPIPPPKRFRIDECSPKQPNYKSIEYFYTYVPYSSVSENDARASYKSTSSDSSMSSPCTSSSVDDEVKVLEIEEHEENSGPQNGGEMENNSEKRSSEEYEDLTTVEKLQKDLYKIMKYERKSLQKNEETVLIYNANRLLVSPNEIGLGSILLKPPTMPAPKPTSFPPPHRSRYRSRQLHKSLQTM